MTNAQRPLIEGRLRLELRESGSARVIARRSARNTVMRSGAELIAALFDGTMATPVNGMAVGLDPTPSEPPYEVASLTVNATDGELVLDLAAAPLEADAISTEVDAENFNIRLTVHGVMPADRAVSPDPETDSVMIGEAALGVLAPTGDALAQIYNRVVFEPIPKRRDHELAFYWEIDFPYGR